MKKSLTIGIVSSISDDNPRYRTKFRGNVSGTEAIDACSDIYIGLMLEAGYSREYILKRFTDRLGNIEDVKLNG